MAIELKKIVKIPTYHVVDNYGVVWRRAFKTKKQAEAYVKLMKDPEFRRKELRNAGWELKGDEA